LAISIYRLYDVHAEVFYQPFSFSMLLTDVTHLYAIIATAAVFSA